MPRSGPRHLQLSKHMRPGRVWSVLITLGNFARGAATAARFELPSCKGGVSNRSFCSRNSAQCHHLGIELFCKRFDHARTQPGFRLGEHPIRLARAIIGNREPPIRP